MKKKVKEEEIEKRDDRGNLIYSRTFEGREYWDEYDKNNNLIYHKSSDDYEWWYKYDKNENLIHFKDSNGSERWYKYDNNSGKRIKITGKEFNEIKFKKQEKEYLNREKVSRFKIMDI